jgi:hypothetical protein
VQRHRPAGPPIGKRQIPGMTTLDCHLRGGPRKTWKVALSY